MTSPNVDYSTPVRTLTPNHVTRNETLLDARSTGRNMKERVEELETSFDAIDDLVTSLSDLGVRRKVRYF